MTKEVQRYNTFVFSRLILFVRILKSHILQKKKKNTAIY